MALGPISEHKRLCVKYRLLNRKNRVVTSVCTISEMDLMSLLRTDCITINQVAYLLLLIKLLDNNFVLLLGFVNILDLMIFCLIFLVPF